MTQINKIFSPKRAAGGIWQLQSMQNLPKFRLSLDTFDALDMLPFQFALSTNFSQLINQDKFVDLHCYPDSGQTIANWTADFNCLQKAYADLRSNQNYGIFRTLNLDNQLSLTYFRALAFFKLFLDHEISTQTTDECNQDKDNLHMTTVRTLLAGSCLGFKLNQKLDPTICQLVLNSGSRQTDSNSNAISAISLPITIKLVNLNTNLKNNYQELLKASYLKIKDNQPLIKLLTEIDSNFGLNKITKDYFDAYVIPHNWWGIYFYGPSDSIEIRLAALSGALLSLDKVELSNLLDDKKITSCELVCK